MKFYEHIRKTQFDMLAFATYNRGAKICADMGAGKTSVCLALVEGFRNQPTFKGCLVIAPKNVFNTTWPAEREKWEDFHNIRMVLLGGKATAGKLSEPADIYVISNTSLKWLYDWMDATPAVHWPFDMLIIDEGSAFRNHTTMRFKRLDKLAPSFHRRVELNGRPVTNGIMNLWAPTKLIDGGAALGRYITHFKKKYFTFNPYLVWDIKPKPGAMEEVSKAIAPITYIIPQEERIKLPPLSFVLHKFKLATAHQKIHKSIKNKMFAELVPGQKILQENTGQKYNALRMLCDGHMKDAEENPIELHKQKLDLLWEVYCSLSGKQLLVSYFYKHSFRMLQAYLAPKLGVKEVPWVGMKPTPEVVADWDAQRCGILLGYGPNIATGLNLQHGGNDVFWFTVTDDLNVFEQLNARLHRPGVDGPVRAHIPLALDTIDEFNYHRLENKDTTQRSVLGIIEAYRKANDETSRSS